MSETIVPIRRASDQCLRQARSDRAGAGPGGERRSALGQRRHPVGARCLPVSSHRGCRLHRPARGSRRPGQDLAPQDPRRNPRSSRRTRRPGHARAPGVSADRPGRRQPVSIRGHRRATRRDPGRGDREHRHRRARTDPGGRQEPRPRRRLDQPRPVRGLDRRRSRPGRNQPGAPTPARTRGLPRNRLAYDQAITDYLGRVVGSPADGSGCFSRAA